MVTPSDALSQTLLEFGRLLVAEEPLEATLRRVADLAKRTLDGCDMASVTIVTNGRPATPAATDDVALTLDGVQYRTGQGPCLSAANDRHEYAVDDAAGEERWPEFARSCVEHGIGSSLSMPLAVEARAMGALNMYGRAAHGFGPADRDVARMFSAQAAVAVANAEVYWRTHLVTEQLRDALEGRDVIGQAKGIIMATRHTTADEAFDLLRRVSQRTNVKLRDIAQHIALTGEIPPDTEAGPPAPG